MRVYIAGPISAPTHEEMVLNTKRFDKAEESWSVWGHEPLNPISLVGHDVRAEDFYMKPWADYLREDIRLLSTADAIYMMKGWRDSKGALLEYHIATVLGMKVFYEEWDERYEEDEE